MSRWTRRRGPRDTGFVNPVAEGADPWVVRDGSRYVWCESDADRGVVLRVGDRLTVRGRPHVVWSAPASGPCSAQVWAPEIHRLDGRWYVYLAASDGDNASHLTYVLASAGEDPLGPYSLEGPLVTADVDAPDVPLWAIDLTVLERPGGRYAVWSGWPAPGVDEQHLYIAPLATPTRLSGPRVRISPATFEDWERVDGPGSRGLHEGPQVATFGDRTFVTYSCGASWTTGYTVGALELVGDDPMEPGSWTRSTGPVMARSSGVVGAGHGCFVDAPDGSEQWYVHHAKTDHADGWRRAIHLQRVTWDGTGPMRLPAPVPTAVAVPRPSGEPVRRRTGPLRLGLRSEADLDELTYHGHDQYLRVSADGTHLGAEPDAPVNTFRSGEKLLVDGGAYTDVTVTVRVTTFEVGRDAGIVLRASRPALGYDAQAGYVVAIVPSEAMIVIGATDGRTWTELGRCSVDVDLGDVVLSATARGHRVSASVDGRPVLTVRDRRHGHGSVGVRVVEGHVRFADLQVTDMHAPRGDG